MSDNALDPRFDDPNFPRVPSFLRNAEKDNFIGILMTSIFYGIVVIFFFQCMVALLNPVDRKKGETKWGLIVHTSAMFSLATIFTGMALNTQSVSYIDGRRFAGDASLLPGPLGYQGGIYSKAIGFVPCVTFLLNQWLSDGLLLYRCHIIYAMNYWVTAFPALMYLATCVAGIVFLYQDSQPGRIKDPLAANTGTYASLSLVLNLLLTLMIVIRLVWHRRKHRSSLGYSGRASEMYQAVGTMLIESSALFTLNSLLFIVPRAARSWVTGIFLPILAETQVIAPFLIILGVARQRELTSNATVCRNLGSIRREGRGESTSRVGTLPGENSTSSVDSSEKTLGGPGVVIGEVHHDRT